MSGSMPCCDRMGRYQRILEESIVHGSCNVLLAVGREHLRLSVCDCHPLFGVCLTFMAYKRDGGERMQSVAHTARRAVHKRCFSMSRLHSCAVFLIEYSPLVLCSVENNCLLDGTD